MSAWGERKGVYRDADATDTARPPGDADPKVALPIRLMTEAEQARAATDWTIVGGSGIAMVGPECLSSDTRSSMEDYWRRRNVIIGADAASFWKNLFQGKNPVGAPAVNAIPIPPGWSCGPWRQDARPPKDPQGALIQSTQGWWRACTAKPKAPKPAIKAKKLPLRPPTPSTPRPALPGPPGKKKIPIGIKPSKPLPGKPPAKPSAEQFEIDRMMEWLGQHEALANELASQPADVRAATLAENPEILYVWILLGWVELDEQAAQTFANLCAELSAVGLSLFDFEAAARADLPPMLAKELAATPLGLAQLCEPTASSAGAVAGEWDAETGIFLPSAPSEWAPELETWIPQSPDEEQRASYGYTPQAPKAGGKDSITPPWIKAQRDERARAKAKGCEPWKTTAPPPPGTKGGFRVEFAMMNRSGTYGGPLPDPRKGKPGKLPGGWGWRACRLGPAIAGCSSCEADDARARARISGSSSEGFSTEGGATCGAGSCGAPMMATIKDPACCPDCALEALGPTARAWAAGIARPAARIGDTWSDVARGLAGADRFLSENVWENVKGVVPYGNIIDVAHKGRMAALEAAAPSLYPGRGTASAGKGAGAGKGGSSSASSDPRTDRAIASASRLAAGVRAGDATAIRSVKGTKDAAREGDPEARRNWAVYVLVSRDEHGTT